MITTIEDTDAWIRRFRPDPGTGNRLVCFPHAGGSASFFHPVAVALDGCADVLAVQYPGRQDRRNEPLVETIDELVERALSVLRPFVGDGTVLFGHSMGAIVAFETALRLHREGRPVARLVVSGRRGPSTVRDEAVHRLDDAALIADIRSLNGTDAQLLVDDEILRMVLPATRNDYRAIETYRCSPGSVLGCPVDVVLGDADPKVTLDEAHRWREHTTADTTVTVHPGGHFYLVEHQRDVVALVRDALTASPVPPRP